MFDCLQKFPIRNVVVKKFQLITEPVQMNLTDVDLDHLIKRERGSIGKGFFYLHLKVSYVSL